jgi:hypothetical protein
MSLAIIMPGHNLYNTDENCVIDKSINTKQCKMITILVKYKQNQSLYLVWRKQKLSSKHLMPRIQSPSLLSDAKIL